MFDQLDDILAVPGIDLVFIAPYDLSQSLGLPGQFDHPKVAQAVQKAEQEVQAVGIDLGGYAGSAARGREMIDSGYKLVMLGYDGMLLETAITPLVDELKR